MAKRVYPETCRPQVQLRMENVCSRVCNHMSALTQVQSLNLYYLQGQKNPSPVISLQYCQAGTMPSSSWQNLLRRKTLSTQAPLESCKSRSAKYELTIKRNSKYRKKQLIVSDRQKTDELDFQGYQIKNVYRVKEGMGQKRKID